MERVWCVKDPVKRLSENDTILPVPPRLISPALFFSYPRCPKINTYIEI